MDGDASNGANFVSKSSPNKQEAVLQICFQWSGEMEILLNTVYFKPREKIIQTLFNICQPEGSGRPYQWGIEWGKGWISEKAVWENNTIEEII